MSSLKSLLTTGERCRYCLRPLLVGEHEYCDGQCKALHEQENKEGK